MRLLAVGGGIVAILMAASLSAEPVKLAPASEWHVNYADDSCRLARAFGEGESRALLMMDRFAPADSFQLIVASRLLTRITAGPDGRRKLTIRFGPGEDEQAISSTPATLQDMPALMSSNVVLGARTDPIANEAELAAAKAKGDDAKARLLSIAVPLAPMTPGREAAVTFLEIAGASKEPVVLDLGRMDKPMAALRTCIDELLTHWGVDAEAHKSLTRNAVPRGNPGRWVTNDDYPTALAARGIQGLIQFRLTIEADGSVSGCSIQQSTRPAEFDATVCRIMSKRARFDPAIDADGNPIKSYWRSSFRFVTQ